MRPSRYSIYVKGRAVEFTCCWPSFGSEFWDRTYIYVTQSSMQRLCNVVNRMVSTGQATKPKLHPGGWEVEL